MSKRPLAILAGFLVAFVIGFGINFALAAAGAEPMQAAWAIAIPIGTFTTLGIMNVGGKRKVKKADGAARAAALSLTPPAGSGLVVVYREGLMGKAIALNLGLDGRDVTQLLGGQFTAVSAAPGRHMLNAVLAGTMNAGSKPGAAEFDLAAGEAAVFRITLAMKMTTSDVVMTRIDDLAAAKAKLAKLPMVAPD